MRRLQVYRCPECGHEIEIYYFGIPHTGSITCIDCKEGMDAIELEDSKFDYDLEQVEKEFGSNKESKDYLVMELDKRIREFVENEQPVTEEEIRENVDAPDVETYEYVNDDEDELFDEVWGLTKTILEKTENGFKIGDET